MMLWVLIGLFGGLEIGPLVGGRDTLPVRLSGAAVGVLAVPLILGRLWAHVVATPTATVGASIAWLFVFGTGLAAADPLRRRNTAARALTVLAACAGSAVAAVLVAAAARDGTMEFLNYSGIPPYPGPAAFSGIILGLWIGLREVLPSKLGARGERLGTVPSGSPASASPTQQRLDWLAVLSSIRCAAGAEGGPRPRPVTGPPSPTSSTCSQARRPLRLSILRRVVRQVGEPRAVRAHDVDLQIPVGALERDLQAVGRPAWPRSGVRPRGGGMRPGDSRRRTPRPARAVSPRCGSVPAAARPPAPPARRPALPRHARSAGRRRRSSLEWIRTVDWR
jgi:hypothetical protein